MSKVVIVTGAGTGIGRSVALAFLREGYSVALAGRRAGLLQDTAKESGAAGSRALVGPTNASDPSAVRLLFAKTKEAFGRLGVLFNKAGTEAPAVQLQDLT